MSFIDEDDDYAEALEDDETYEPSTEDESEDDETYEPSTEDESEDDEPATRQPNIVITGAKVSFQDKFLISGGRVELFFTQ
jgi:hypothetical protein